MSRISNHYRPRHGSSPQYPPKVAYDDDEALPQREPPQPPDMEPPVQRLSGPHRPNIPLIMWCLKWGLIGGGILGLAGLIVWLGLSLSP